MNVRYGKYELRPSPNSLCWELFEYRTVKGENERDEWVSMGVYPSTFGSGLAEIYERALKDKKDHSDLHAAVTTARRIYKDLVNIK